jgi:hypothetical protein
VTPIRSVTPETLGAWVIKCNARKTAVAPFRVAGAAKPTWCVADNYRSRLIRPGHRVLFWVSAHSRRGLWGAGRITAGLPPQEGEFYVYADIPLFTEPITAAELSAVPGLHAMEVFRSPQQANPSWVNATELALIEPLLPSDFQLS